MSVLLLIDVDNVIGGNNPRPETVTSHVQALTAVVEAATNTRPTIAAGYRRPESGSAAIADALRALDVTALPVAEGRDASDNALLRWAAETRTESTRFFVASADRAFAAVAEWGSLEVVVWDEQPVAGVLSRSARRVHRVARPPRRATRSQEAPPHSATIPAKSPHHDEVNGCKAEPPDFTTAAAAKLGVAPDSEAIQQIARAERTVRRVDVSFKAAYLFAGLLGTVGFLIELLLVGETAYNGYARAGFIVALLAAGITHYHLLRRSVSQRLVVELWRSLLALLAAERSNLDVDLWSGLKHLTVAGRILETQTGRWEHPGPHPRLAARLLGRDLRLRALPELGRHPREIATELITTVASTTDDVVHGRWIASVPATPIQAAEWQQRLLDIDRAPTLTIRAIRLVMLFGVSWGVTYLAWSAVTGHSDSPTPQLSGALALAVMLWAGTNRTDQLVSDSLRRFTGR
ncbi:hypothetical protein [Actinoalloteichus fjordicus]|uniref:Uncharacterized protein n=1 Tax=Actinoalloteichus fjordicus TaxID=1612552 RepID=A0AAC9LCD7_9PSEU|nr:hypothetical protein [Actinoalloteichus fjordicus]APU15223.1 hypothetical protein UA74_15855 [Actinoalloteichus fjordicus]